MPGAKRKAARPAPAKGVKGGAKGSDNSKEPAIGGFETTEIRRLILLVQETGVGEIEIRSGTRVLRVAAPGGAPVVAAPVERREATALAPSAATPAPADSTLAITAPMVGTFYRAPAPDADPYVENGDTVEVGQTVCIVEAMKLMNEIQSEVRGRVVRILVENAQPVEFGQKLFLVEPL
jgi:acetyl-CoA carboxylase biotin carboxyl carrier protein